MRLLITGAGRTGSSWLTFALMNCGINAEHESAFNIHRHGDVSWSCEISWLAAPYTADLNDDVHVVHLVRDPLRAISSRAGWGSFEDHEPSGKYDPRIKGRWAAVWLPEILNGQSPIERAAIHWAGWNELVVGADEVLRIEDTDRDTIVRLARLVDSSAEPGVIPPKTINQATGKPLVDWMDVEKIPGLIAQATKWRYL